MEKGNSRTAHPFSSPWGGRRHPAMNGSRCSPEDDRLSPGLVTLEGTPRCCRAPAATTRHQHGAGNVAGEPEEQEKPRHSLILTSGRETSARAG